MTDIVTTKQIPLATLEAAILQHKNNPTAILSKATAFFREATDGQVEFLDATNPTSLLLTFGAAAASAAMGEHNSLLRYRYPTLAEKPEDLYYHMADRTMMNRFATPGFNNFHFYIAFTPLKRDMVRDEAEKCLKAIIPRYATFSAPGTPYTLLYPIEIRLYDSGSLEVRYNTDEMSPFQELEQNILTPEIITAPSGEELLHFTAQLPQIQLMVTEQPLESATPFAHTFPYPDQYYHARVFVKSGDGGFWNEILTTHNDFTFDRRNVTAVLQVDEGELKVKIPQIYQTMGLRGTVRVMIHTTRGGVTENLADKEITAALRPSFGELDEFHTRPFMSAAFLVESEEVLSNGKDGLSFEQLRARTIYNSIGPQVLPITPAQIQAGLENKGYRIFLEDDAATSRCFLAQKALPKPSNPSLITAANIGIQTMITHKEELQNHPFVRMNADRWTLMPNNLYSFTNGVVRLMSALRVQEILNLPIPARVQYLNNNEHLFTPFHYVLDNTNNEFRLRAYYLTKPKTGLINFMNQNHSLQLPVNTATKQIEATPTGYRLTITTRSGENYKSLPDAQVGTQLMFYPKGEQIPVYIRGNQQSVDPVSFERTFTFDIQTNFDLDDRDRLQVLGVGIDAFSTQDVWMGLETELHIFHCTSSKTTIYQPGPISAHFGDFQFGPGFVPITHEKISLHAGDALTNLWRRCRTLASGTEYEFYPENVHAFWEDDVYEEDPVTGDLFTVEDGEIVFKYLHRKGDPILNADGSHKVLHLKDTPKLNPETGRPMVKPSGKQFKEIDLLFIDGRHYFVNDTAYVAYNEELYRTIVQWVVTDLKDITPRTLEKTEVFFHPKSQLGLVTIETSNGFRFKVPSEQSPRLLLTVDQRVYDNTMIREEVERKIIRLLDEELQDQTLNFRSIFKRLETMLGDTVLGIKLWGFGSKDKEVNYGVLTSTKDRFSLRRLIVAQSDQSLIMKEDVVVEWEVQEDRTLER